jgi:hypothetical protein
MGGAMKVEIGPFPRERILLCSADAGPNSQRQAARDAGHFFPRAKWVGTLRNVADLARVQFVILTTGHGMVYPWEVIEPFDAHIDICREIVRRKWIQTIPRVIGKSRYDIMVFYAGGCPREAYIGLLRPILAEYGNVDTGTLVRK